MSYTTNGQDYKYFTKIKKSDGSYRYFYSKEEYEAYTRGMEAERKRLYETSPAYRKEVDKANKDFERRARRNQARARAKKNLDEAVNTYKNGLDIEKNAVKSAGRAVTNTAKSAVNTYKNGLDIEKNAVKSAGRAVTNTAKSAVNTYKNGLDIEKNAVKSAGKNTKNAVSNFANERVDDWKTGANIISSTAKSISENNARKRATAAKEGKEAIDAILNLLDPRK